MIKAINETSEAILSGKSLIVLFFLAEVLFWTITSIKNKKTKERESTRVQSIMIWVRRYLYVDIIPAFVEQLKDKETASSIIYDLTHRLEDYVSTHSPDDMETPEEAAGIFLGKYLAWYFNLDRGYKKYYGQIEAILKERCMPRNAREQEEG